MKTVLAFAAGLVASAMLAAFAPACADCTHTVHELPPGVYRMDPAAGGADPDYELTYSADPPAVVETFTRNGTPYRIEYTPSAPSP
jgi:hypothetical protein